MQKQNQYINCVLLTIIFILSLEPTWNIIEKIHGDIKNAPAIQIFFAAVYVWLSIIFTPDFKLIYSRFKIYPLLKRFYNKTLSFCSIFIVKLKNVILSFPTTFSRDDTERVKYKQQGEEELEYINSLSPQAKAIFIPGAFLLLFTLLIVLDIIDEKTIVIVQDVANVLVSVVGLIIVILNIITPHNYDKNHK